MYHILINGQKTDERTEEKLKTVMSVFAVAGKELTVHRTQRPGHATEIVRELTSDGKFAHLIAMGGDGTLHEVLNGIADTENCTLGLIPIGTGNDFATATGIPFGVKEAAENIVFRAPVAIDYIELDSGLRSINAVGMGIDVDVLKHVYDNNMTGKNKYLKAFIKCLRTYRSIKVKASWDGGEEKIYDGMIACLGNGRQIGGGIMLFPDAKIDDGYMDLIVLNYLSRFKTLLAFIKLTAGKVNKIKDVTHVRCKTASLIPVDGDTAIQAEGEIYENHSLKARIVTGKLKFYLPRTEE